MNESEELEIQKRIFLLISNEPGLHITKIAELINISEPLVLYHIRYLERHDLISIEKQEGYTRCYLKGAIGVEDKKKFSLLRRQIPLQIVLFLLKNPNSKHKDLLVNFNLAKSTLSYHLNKLVKHGIICVQQEGYSVIDEPGIIKFLMKYKPLRVAVGVKETWEDFTIHRK